MVSFKRYRTRDKSLFVSFRWKDRYNRAIRSLNSIPPRCEEWGLEIVNRIVGLLFSSLPSYKHDYCRLLWNSVIIIIKKKKIRKEHELISPIFNSFFKRILTLTLDQPAAKNYHYLEERNDSSSFVLQQLSFLVETAPTYISSLRPETNKNDTMV